MARHPFHRNLIRSFVRDERGAFAVMFGVMAIVLIALGGAVVDFVSLQQHRNQAQLALDAAALALQPRIFESDFDKDEVQALAQAFVDERVNAGVVTANITNTVAIQDDGSLHFEAMVHVPTTFVRLVGVNDLNAFIESEATRKKLALEVVMVLDNSGSMDQYSRMSYLKSAARCATNTLFYDAVETGTDPNSCVPTAAAEMVENVKMAVVPFTMFVNVGSGNANQPWIDRFGASVISNDNFDNDDDEDRLVTTAPGYTWPNRFTLFTATGKSWLGCVEERPHIKSGDLETAYLDTDDTEPTSGNTLFVPLFAPDMATNYGTNNYVSDSPAVCDRPAQGNTRCIVTEQRTRTSGVWSAPVVTNTDVRGPTDYVSSALYPNAFYGRLPPSCSCRSATPTSWSGSGSTQTRTTTCTSFVPQSLSPRELQERMCKYYAGVGSTTFSSGPNGDCVRTPIRPLVDEPQPILDTITAMQAEGGTNIHTGTAWGFRVISPDLPFDEGAEYDEATSKVMIIMTDGENTAYKLAGCGNVIALNGSCYNSAYGYPVNSHNTAAASTSGGNIERLGSLTVTNETLVSTMNERTSQTCTNAKAAGITVYTIGLSTNNVSQSTPDVVRAMLRNCASTPDKAYFPDAPSELKSVFASIANELSALRLAR